jgi:predicted ATPase/class 3 adenylate cyclase
MSIEITTWLRGLGLEQFAPSFIKNDIDAGVLPELTADDLIGLGVTSIGHRRKLLAAIAALRDGAPVAAAPVPPAEPGRRGADAGIGPAERRQLTVMFCDLVGSTALSASLDPEDMRRVLSAYQDAVAHTVTLYDGYVAKLLGDGVLVYFGYPRAHEDDAERAVRAALGLVAAVPALQPLGDMAIACRIGVATGLVVVGAASAGGIAEQAVTGDTPNLAARLQDIAPVNGVAIAASTRHLLGDGFELRELGWQSLKGLAEPVPVWCVIGERDVESRFAAAHAQWLSRFIGRDSEVAMLLERWELAETGEGQAVLLSGEAGIGKSRTCETLRERLADRLHGEVRYQCSPYHANSTLYPALRQLEHMAGIVEADPLDQRPLKLESALHASGLGLPAVAIGLLSRAFGWPEGDRLSGHAFSPEQEKARTLAVLAELLTRPADNLPTLALIEDVHWIDATTQELIGLAIDRVRDRKVLLLITHRPEFQPPWGGHAHLTRLAMNRLSQRQCADLALETARGKRLPETVVREIIAKTDGIPLFVEELTKAVLESGLLIEDEAAYRLDGPLPPLAIPSSLHDSLTARLDRLSPAKEVAQFGAAIGREFSRVLLAAASGLSAATLDDALARLLDAELVFRRDTGDDEAYSFKHALIRDAAYDSILKSTRQVIHRRIAGTLAESDRDATVAAPPELIAHHLTEGGLPAEAIPYWTDAGERAVERSANHEAIAHLSRARDLLHGLPEGEDRDRLELRMSMPLGTAMMATRGTVDPDVNALFERARRLGARLTDGERYFNATWNLWLVCHTTRKFPDARALSLELIDLARRGGDPDQVLQANHAAWPTGLVFGELAHCDALIEQALPLYDAARHYGHAHRFGGHDPAICGCAFSGIVGWLRGETARSIARTEEGLRRAEQRDHPMSRALAAGWGSVCYLLHGDHARVLVLADLAERMEREFQFGTNQWISLAYVARAGAMAATGDRAEGVVRLKEIIDSARYRSYASSTSLAISLLASAYRSSGDHSAAVALLDEGIGKVTESGEAWLLAELLRQRGEALLDLGRDRSEAENMLRSALTMAHRQGAVSLVTRSVVSLSRLLHDTGRATEADTLRTSLPGST